MSMSVAERAESVVRNHPAARRMAAIAFLSQNITFACIWGSFSVVLGSVETRLGVGRELSTLAIPVLSLVTAVLAAMAGALATRLSLRLVMMAGAALSTAGFALLALTTSYPLYLIAYGLLLGPAMAIAVVLPPTLVTRWYLVNRGQALGIELHGRDVLVQRTRQLFDGIEPRVEQLLQPRRVGIDALNLRERALYLTEPSEDTGLVVSQNGGRGLAHEPKLVRVLEDVRLVFESDIFADFELGLLNLAYNMTEIIRALLDIRSARRHIANLPADERERVE